MISNWWHRALIRKPKSFRREKSTVQPHRFRPLLELLEDRNLMATITVTSLTDEIDHTKNNGTLTLREAIILVNSNNDSALTANEKLLVTGDLSLVGDTINFSIAGGNTITITSGNGGELDTIFEQVTIDGLNTATGKNIILTGNGSLVGDGLTLGFNDNSASFSIIRGLVINGFQGNGIVIEATQVTNVLIEGNFIGTDALGTTAVPNTGNGISIISSDNTIGGTGAVGLGAGLGNLISGNGGDGILIFGSGATGNLIQGNFIGTDKDGTGPLGNGGHGVEINASDLNTVSGNVISSNGFVSTSIPVANAGFEGPALADNSFTSGIITDWVTGGPGGGFGVFNPPVAEPTSIPEGSQTAYVNENQVIEQTLTAVLTPNTLYTLQVDVVKRSVVTLMQYTVELFAGGTLLASDSSLAPLSGEFLTSTVVYFASATDPLLGQPLTIRLGSLLSQPNFDNVRLSAGTVGNTGDGILLTGSGATGNLIQGNFIGTDATGAGPLGNGGNGVAITNGANLTSPFNGADFNTIGGFTGQGNVIAFNGKNGVLVGTTAKDNVVNNTILGNSIFANGDLGIDLGGDDVTPNDPGDVDSSPNFFQNFPTLIAAVVVGADVVISFTIGDFSAASFRQYRIEFFASDSPDPSRFGEGQQFLGSVLLSNSNPPEVFTFTIVGGASLSARFITATATEFNDSSFRSTSEFSNVMTLPIDPVPSDPVPLIVVPPPEVDNDPIIVDTLEGDPPRPILPIFVVTFQTFEVSTLPPAPTLRQVRVLSPLQRDPLQNLVDAPGEIHGQILDDPDALGKAGPDTFPLDGQPVFLDFNRNGLYDDGEPITVTNSKGEYTFTSLTAGQYSVHLLLGRSQDVTFGPKQDNKVELRSGNMVITNVDFGVRFRARRRPGGRTALPWHADGVLLAAGVASPGAVDQYGLDSLPLAPSVPEPSATFGENDLPVADSDAPVSGLRRWCGWLLGAALLTPWQHLANRRKPARREQGPR